MAQAYGQNLMSGTEGERLHKEIVAALRRPDDVVLDFSSVRVLVSAFLNPAIGNLYYDFEPIFLNTHLRFENCSQVQSSIINEVLKNARQHILDAKDVEAQRDALRKMFPE